MSALTGIQFGDNGGQNFVTEQNGVAIATTEVLLNSKKLFQNLQSLDF